MNLFYTPEIAERPELPEEESRHAVQVLRLESGSPLLLTDGKGTFYQAEIQQPHPRHSTVQIREQTYHPRPWQGELVIAVAPTKQMERMEWFVEKSTEIGINAVALLRCSRSERREVRIDRLRKIQISAMKQSQQAWLPSLEEMVDFSRFVTQPFPGEKYIAYCGEEHPKQLLQEHLTPGSSALILIGPEGDFTPEEVDQALRSGFRPVSLGHTRLRTETAALVACHTFQQIQQTKPI